MKYKFLLYFPGGHHASSKPLTREELDETIRVHLDNGCTCFSVEAVED